KPPSTPTPVTPTPVTPTPITPTPTAKHTDTQLRGAVENGKTTIFLKVCGKGKHYRFQSFSVDQNQILWDKVYGAIDGCSKEYRAAINAETGEVLRFTSTVMNGTISDSEFNQRRRDTCRIDSPGVIRCRQSDTPPPTTPTPNPGTDKTLDVRYVDQVYVQQYPENGYWNHCGPASAAMVLHYEKKELRDVLYNRQATLSLVCETKPTCYGASSPAKILNLFKQHGLNATIDWSTSFNEIKNSIDRGHPVLISIGGANHIAAAVGYRDDGTILINDPFGGKHWWSNPKNVNLRNDYINGTWTTYPSKPQLKGVEVPYIFGSEITAFYTIPISGPASKPQRLATEIDRTTGGILNAGQAILRFTGHSDVSNAQEISDTITVGYTSQFAPSYPVNQHDTAIASFVVDATNAENLSIASYGQLFEMTITLDEKIIDNWYISNGKTIGSDQASTNPIEPVTVLAQDDPGKIDASRLIITAWSPDTQQWIPLETSVDLDKYLVTASHDQFTEFAVMVEREYTVTLPLIIH
ncbi:MAG: C39 family peptidase, partial [Chloroflexaceae bacterium]